MSDSQYKVNWTYLAIRRSVEVLLILLFLPVLIVLFLLLFVWIKFDSAGSVFFNQLRPGKDGKLFKIYKFRSMYTGADSSFLTLEADERVTRSGKFIRKYRLDELPQLYNILIGDMSLIGPRPVPVNFYDYYLQNIPHYNKRHEIRPGITGLAQVRQGYTTTLDEERMKFKYDLFYIRSLSLKLDLAILLQSVNAVNKN
ncbi:sugar transferase [Mucilaginibacter psychrotolerans]|uniref:Sugar transferase n=1 Tax=Mucilaginibacter psychrotolerans TaxID=1524096 RepID=A0A4Y8S4Y4_9SPHI|nr:sugar transferase [Mucilaginibacter psychrotolerans]TFF33972.1 sugar transferase [Mucilaginibacter psychrotolerans]